MIWALRMPSAHADANYSGGLAATCRRSKRLNGGDRSKRTHQGAAWTRRCFPRRGMPARDRSVRDGSGAAGRSSCARRTTRRQDTFMCATHTWATLLVTTRTRWDSSGTTTGASWMQRPPGHSTSVVERWSGWGTTPTTTFTGVRPDRFGAGKFGKVSTWTSGIG